MTLLELFKTRIRHPYRPRSSDMIQRLFTNFCQYKVIGGDTLIMGEGYLTTYKTYVVGQQKPKPEQFSSSETVKRLNWGMMNADEHSQLLNFLQQLHKNGPHENAILLSFVDTYGADISMYSALRLQAFFIANLIHAYLTVPIRTVSIILGEGGSGGALALQLADRRAALEDSLYATAPPESLAAIIFRDPNRIEDALIISKSTAKDLKYFKIIDSIIPQTKQVEDADSLAEHLRTWLVKTFRDLFRRSLNKCINQRFNLAEKQGNMRQGRFYELKRFIEHPLTKYLYKSPSDIKVVVPSGSLDVEDSYGNDLTVNSKESYVRCGEERKENNMFYEGCGAIIPLNEYLTNFQVCHYCGRQRVLDAAGWISVLADYGSFHELFPNISAYDLLTDKNIHKSYQEFLDKQKKRSSFNESLVTAEATIYGYPVVLAISEFAFAAGSMGVVFGEKFRLAVSYALRKFWPLVSVCCSGGARLYEGIIALMQMSKTIASVIRLKQAGLPFISILADPSTGGAIASYAALGDICLAEPEAMVIFAGPRVMKDRGFDIEKKAIRSNSLFNISAQTLEHPNYYGKIRGIQEVIPRHDMRRALVKYLEFYAHIRTSQLIKTKKKQLYIRQLSENQKT